MSTCTCVGAGLSGVATCPVHGTRRKPLRPEWTRDDDPRRIEALRQQGLDADMNPLGASALEREANRIIKENPTMSLQSEPTKTPPAAPAAPFVPPAARKVAGVVAMVGGLLLMALPALPFALPVWAGFAVFALTSIASFLAALALPGFAPSKPIIPLTLVPAALAVYALLLQLASNLPPGTFQSAVMLAAVVVGAAAGKAIPPPASPSPAAVDAPSPAPVEPAQ